MQQISVCCMIHYGRSRDSGYTIHMEEQVALVTGAGQRIGAAIAKKLAEAGAQIVINDVCE